MKKIVLTLLYGTALLSCVQELHDINTTEDLGYRYDPKNKTNVQKGTIKQEFNI